MITAKCGAQELVLKQNNPLYWVQGNSGISCTSIRKSRIPLYYYKGNTIIRESMIPLYYYKGIPEFPSTQYKGFTDFRRSLCTEYKGIYESSLVLSIRENIFSILSMFVWKSTWKIIFLESTHQNLYFGTQISGGRLSFTPFPFSACDIICSYYLLCVI